VRAGHIEPGGGPVGSAATLSELAEKLSTLRAHLDQVVTSLKAPAEGRLLCHECGQMASSADPGWSLRLCADDALHAFCPDCDEESFNRNGTGDKSLPQPPGGREA
jgi:hypothetical protein